MKNLFQKVLEVKHQKNHSVDDINILVKSTIKNLNTQYKRGQNIKKIEDSYISKEYKAFITYLKNDSKELDRLFTECIIDETRIANFVKGDTKRPHHKTKDFFAVYCGCDGYNDFIVKYKNVDYVKETLPELNSKSEILISGATIINQEFISSIKDGKPYTMSEFYGAKLNNCQWYGVINNFDITRNEYQNLRSVVVDSFNQDKDFKISAWVIGDGGSGKSTVLKRLSHDIGCQGKFTVLWVDNSDDFFEKGLQLIKKNIEKECNLKYLIVIEDWYRMFDNKTKVGKRILEELHKIDNIRLVIGDRNSVNKPYEKYGNEFEMYLSVDENQEIIEKIIEKFPNWKHSAEKIFKTKENYQSTLFLLLFILARITPNESDKPSLNFSDPQNVFRNIIKSDLKSVPKKYFGLAKALYYWGSFYAQYKILISYDTFLKIADFYNGKDNDEISELFSRWNIKDDVLDKLKIYININHRIDKFNTSDLLRFNHDILTDIGISKLSFKKWDKFGDKIKIQLLNFITEKGDDYSASKFLEIMLSKEYHLFKNLEDKLTYIKRLVEKGNNQPHYIYVLTGFSLNNQRLKELAKLFWDRKIFSVIFWGSYFRSVENDTIVSDHISEILSITNIEKYDFDFICVILEYTEKTNERNRFVEEVLMSDKRYTIHPKIINFCLKYCEDAVKQDFFKKTIDENNWMIINNSFKQYLISLNEVNKVHFIRKILDENQWKNINSYNLSLFLEYLKDEMRNCFADKVLGEGQKELGSNLIQRCFSFATYEAKQKFSNRILKNSEWSDYTDNFICTCLSYTIEEIQLEFSNNLLSKNNWENVEYSLIYSCMLIANENVKREFSDVFLNNKRSDKLKSDISLFISCFNYATYSTRQNFSNRFFQNKEATLLKLKNNYIVISCLEYTTRDNVKEYFYSTFLRNKKWYRYDNKFIYNCLKFFEAKDKISSDLSIIITTIINEFHHSSYSSKAEMKNPSFVKRDRNRLKTQYLFLLRVNFYNHPLWRQETINIIKNWRLKNKKVVASVLYSYRSRPDEIYNICSIFLSQERTKVYKPMSQLDGYMSILKIALGHPKLKGQSKQTASQILHDLQENRKIKVSSDLKNILTKIVESDVYPEWQL